MKTSTKALITAALVVAVIGVVALKKTKAPPRSEPVSQSAVETKGPLPRLVDLGADKCIPCKMMAPVLDELKKDYSGRLDVQFIDVWKNPDAGTNYGVEMIPTQIFFDANGKELFRHTGFFGKEDILAKWKELGVDVEKK